MSQKTINISAENERKFKNKNMLFFGLKKTYTGVLLFAVSTYICIICINYS